MEHQLTLFVDKYEGHDVSRIQYRNGKFRNERFHYWAYWTQPCYISLTPWYYEM